MHRILRPRRLHFEHAAGFSRQLDPATGGSLSCDISESFRLRAPDPIVRRHALWDRLRPSTFKLPWSPGHAGRSLPGLVAVLPDATARRRCANKMKRPRSPSVWWRRICVVPSRSHTLF